MARNIKDIVTGAMRSVFGSRAPAETKTNAVDVTLAAQVKPEELHGLAELVAGMLCDPMTEICMSLKTGNLKRADVTFKVESGDEARDEVVAEDLQRLWLDTLEKLCDIRNGVLTWGGLPFERVEENLIVDGIPLTRIQQFKQLPKLVNGKKATERIVAPDGSFGGIHITIGQEDSILPPERSAWFAIGATPLDPHGKSVFIGAPEKVLEQRRKANKEFDTFVSRWAVSQMVVHAPLWGIGPNNERVNNHDRIAEKFLEKLKSGGVLILDNEAAGPNMEGKYAVDITHEPQTLDAQPMEITDKMIDSRMCMAFGIHPSVVMDTETGSYAAATVRKTIVDIQSDSEVSQLTTQFREAVADWYVARNYPEGTGVKVTISPVSLVTDGYMAEIAKTLVTGATLNPLVSSGAIDLDRMLANVGFPMEEDAEEILDALYEQGTQPAEDAGEFDPAIEPDEDAADEAVKKKSAQESVSQLMQ